MTDTTFNGSAVINKTLPAGSAEVIRALEETLAQARAGQFTTIVLTCIGPMGAGSCFAGNDLMPAYFALDVAKDQVKAAITNPAKRSPILRPR